LATASASAALPMSKTPPAASDSMKRWKVLLVRRGDDMAGALALRGSFL
jgi:hypothetical protein